MSLLDSSLSFEGNAGHSNFDTAFYIAIAEMKIRAYKLGEEAIIDLRMDFDLDNTNYGAFYLNMYGTVVRKNRMKDFIEDEMLKKF